jgi:hypothetical protein
MLSVVVLLFIAPTAFRVARLVDDVDDVAIARFVSLFILLQLLLDTDPSHTIKELKVGASRFRNTFLLNRQHNVRHPLRPSVRKVFRER